MSQDILNTADKDTVSATAVHGKTLPRRGNNGLGSARADQL